MSETSDIPEDLTAAEYVLGVLDAEGRAAAEARLAADPEFSNEAAWWEGRLAPLSDQVAAVAPRAELWPRIEAALGRPENASTPAAANDDHQVLFWRRWAMGASGVAAASIVALLVTLSRPPQIVQAPAPAPTAPVVATLKAQGGAVALVATFDSRANALVLAPVGAAPNGPVPTLWLLKRGGGVQRVGPMDMTKPTRIAIDPTVAATARGALGLAVSLEPAGVVASKPAGPVIASGAFETV